MRITDESYILLGVVQDAIRKRTNPRGVKDAKSKQRTGWPYGGRRSGQGKANQVLHVPGRNGTTLVRLRGEIVDMWRIALRDGFIPLLSVTDLEQIQKALMEDDGTLLQGITTHPEAYRENLQKPVEACCLVSYSGWKSGLQTVEEVEEYFARACSEIDARLGNISECRWLLNWFDETPREEMRRLLSEEIHVEIQRRKLSGKE